MTFNRRYRPKQISYTRLGERKGSLRLWLEGLRLPDVGFDSGTKFNIEPFYELGTLVLKADENGSNTVSSRQRSKDSLRTPIVDINRKELEELFGDGRLLRVMYHDNKLIAQLHSHEQNRALAMEDLRANISAQKLSMGTICVGGGICSNALKEGMKVQGVDCESEWVIDIENKYLQNAMNNTGVMDEDTIVVEGALGDVEVDHLTPVNVLNVSLPCTGFSTAGRSKNKLENPESHKSAGTAILKTVAIIEKLLPPVITNENVIPFISSASADLFAGRLKELGYNIQARVFGGEMGTLEDRKRSIMVATHKDIEFNMDAILPVVDKEATLADVLESLPNDHPSWKKYEYLAEKEKRDIAAGKGFRRQLLTGGEKSTGVAGRGYGKARGTEPFIVNEDDPTLSRLYTLQEHCATMKIPSELIANNSKTVGHEIVGQSGSYALFLALGQWQAKTLKHNFNLGPAPKTLEELSVHDGVVQPISFDSVDIEGELAHITDNQRVELTPTKKVTPF